MINEVVTVDCLKRKMKPSSLTVVRQMRDDVGEGRSNKVGERLADFDSWHASRHLIARLKQASSRAPPSLSSFSGMAVVWHLEVLRKVGA